VKVEILGYGTMLELSAPGRAEAGLVAAFVTVQLSTKVPEVPAVKVMLVVVAPDVIVPLAIPHVYVQPVWAGIEAK